MFRIRINQSKPPWGILTVLILITLVLIASVHPVANSRVLTVSNTEIIVEGADSVQEFDFVQPAETLLNLAGEVMSRIIIQHADRIIHHNLIEIPIPQFAINAIAEAREAIKAGSAKGLNMAEAEALLSRAEGGLAVEDYEEAISLARQAEAAAEVIKADAEAALEEIAAARGAIEAGRAEGLDMAKAEILLSRAEGALQAEDFGRAKELVQQAETKVEGIRRAAALEQIYQAREAITTGRAEAFDMADAEDLFQQAEKAFQAEDYRRSKNLAEQAEVAAQEVKREVQAALDAICQASNVIKEGIAKRLNMTRAEVFLLQAEQALEEASYERAFEMATKARSLALDVDQDGVLNYRDFAPTVNNNHIYIGAFAFALSLLIGIFSHWQKKEAKKKRFERKKRAILAMIDEVVNQDRR